MKKFLLIVLMLIFSAGYTFAQKHITINEDCVYLDELTASHIPHNKVECGIKAGSKKLITKDIIQSHLDDAGIKGTVLNDVLVARQWEKLSYEKISEYIENEYKKAYPDMKIVVDQFRISEDIYDNPDVKMNISCDTSKLGGGYAQLKLGNSKYQIYYYVKGYKDAYITTERIKAGDSLAGKVKKVSVEVTNLKNEITDNAESLAASRAVPAGKVITADIVQEKPALKKGEAVKIIVSNGILHIETQGVVEENAMLGKQVLVRNLTSQKVISGSYIGNGIVKADF
ncbi:MAG: flagellar basal body P-ring formation chaperone FlgA [Mucispirillum sp.]|nr:flagellar basal body P-ring formation chaperone FlgA [Mucispirillum sp.]